MYKNNAKFNNSYISNCHFLRESNYMHIIIINDKLFLIIANTIESKGPLLSNLHILNDLSKFFYPFIQVVRPTT